mgnify:CR=1 FL=1
MPKQGMQEGCAFEGAPQFDRTRIVARCSHISGLMDASKVHDMPIDLNSAVWKALQHHSVPVGETAIF